MDLLWLIPEESENSSLLILHEGLVFLKKGKEFSMKEHVGYISFCWIVDHDRYSLNETGYILEKTQEVDLKSNFYWL